MLVVRKSPQQVTQLAAVPQIDELCAPTNDDKNPTKIESLRAALRLVPELAEDSLVEDVTAALGAANASESSLATGLSRTAAQHVVAGLSDTEHGALCASDAEPGRLARDLGIGAEASGGDNLQSMGLPLRV